MEDKKHYLLSRKPKKNFGITYVRKHNKIYRNDKCHCGSELKYKKCCIDKENNNELIEYKEIELN